MFDPDKQNLCPPLPFECPSCLYYGNGRCRGPVNMKTYTMRDQALVTCVNLERKQQRLDDLYSRMPPIPKESHQDKIVLPSFIAGITNALKELSYFPKRMLFAVSLATLLGEKGTILPDCADALRHKLRLPADARLALIGTAKDYKIERLWTSSEKTNVWRRIADFGFEFVTSLTYSVFDEQPRTDQIYNQDRNFVTHDYFANLGVPSIPFFYPYNDEDYREAFAWLRERPDIKKIAVLAQFYRTEKQFAQLLRNMRILQEGARRPIEFLVVGVGTYSKIASVLSEFAATIVSAKPFHKAISGFRTLSDLSHPEQDELRHSFSYAELAVHNVEQYFGCCENLREQYQIQSADVQTTLNESVIMMSTR